MFQAEVPLVMDWRRHEKKDVRGWYVFIGEEGSW
jgi:hypothetical protein